MDVAARSASSRADADTVAIDLRSDERIGAGTFEWRGPDVETGWHRNPFHQVEYALEGVDQVETAAGRYLLPPQRAIWIPAGLDHHTVLQNVHSISLFFDPALVPRLDDRARVLVVDPLVREMLAYGLRWPIGRTHDGPDPEAERSATFFAALSSVLVDGLGREAPLHLPTTTDPALAGVLAYTEAHLATVTVAEVCSVIGLSERTLRRRSLAAIGISWQEYLVQSRLLRVAAMLAEGDRSVVEVALTVGYENQSSFARAFRRWMDESPTTYRRRMRDVADTTPVCPAG